LLNQRKKEDPKKVYERLKKHRLNTKTEKLEITGLETKIKDEFKDLKGLEEFTNALKLKKLIELWYAKEPVISVSESELNQETGTTKNIDKNVKEDEFNKLIDELVKYQLKSFSETVNKKTIQKDLQFQAFLANLEQQRAYRYETVIVREKVHDTFYTQLIRQIDPDVESALGKDRGANYFVLISKIISPEKVYYYKDSSLTTTLKYYDKIKFSRKQARDKFRFLSGEWKQ